MLRFRLRRRPAIDRPGVALIAKDQTRQRQIPPNRPGHAPGRRRQTQPLDEPPPGKICRAEIFQESA